jgi:hypothetical protein
MGGFVVFLRVEEKRLLNGDSNWPFCQIESRTGLRTLFARRETEPAATRAREPALLKAITGALAKKK